LKTASRKRALRLCATLLAAYVVCYLGYRQTHLERWARDGRDYVIFASSAPYYIFRPMSHLDRFATGVGAHIGPHR
jgi:hypothetical protein